MIPTPPTTSPTITPRMMKANVVMSDPLGRAEDKLRATAKRSKKGFREPVQTKQDRPEAQIADKGRVNLIERSDRFQSESHHSAWPKRDGFAAFNTAINPRNSAIQGKWAGRIAPRE